MPGGAPRTLRAAFAAEPLPEWIRQTAGLGPGATLASLATVAPARSEHAERRLRLFCVRLLRNRPAQAWHVRVADRPWPGWIDPAGVSWPQGTGETLRRAGLLEDASRLSGLTYGGLLELPLLGAKRVVDVALVLEQTLDRASEDGPADEPLATRALAAAPWASLVSAADPRFADILGPAPGTLADRLSAALGDNHAALALDALAPAIQARAREIDEAPLDLALRALLDALGQLGPARLDAVVRRLGVDGGARADGAEVATLSRERVRQLTARTRGRLPSHPVYLPALERALELLAAAAPCAADGDGAALLKTRGVTTVPFHPASVLRAARLCGHEAAFTLERIGGRTFLVTGSPGPATASVLGFARRLAMSYGAASLAEVARAAAAQGFPVGVERVRHDLLVYGSAELLDEGWFWLPGLDRDRLTTLTRRMLAVASRLDVATLRAGIRRAYSGPRAARIAPETVLETLYRSSTIFDVDAERRVGARAALDYRLELPLSDRVLAETLLASWVGIADRATLRRACLARGLSAHACCFALGHSPILDHPGRNAWCLRGTRVTPVTLAALTHVERLRRTRAARAEASDARGRTELTAASSVA